ncbi:MAG: metallophosphoesterase [Gaiellaceae bacterium MAG52_C11]|nr:metallophosphoesterase [Candidatus Gaiellasilicea maunaloa]
MTSKFRFGQAALVAGLLAYGWFEAGWLRTRVLEVPLPGLPAELDGLRVAHLSDFHLGEPSRGARASMRAVAWVASREPDLVCITGDLLSRPGGEPLLRRLLERLGPAYAVLGNHDRADSRDPLSQKLELTHLGVTDLLSDESRVLELRGRRVQIVGVDPASYSLGVARPERHVDGTAELRILLCHFPGVARALEPGAYDLVLAGHVHGGQIVLPYPGGRFLFAHPLAGEHRGIYRQPGTTLHVSPGVGTTFVPFRFFSRPEVTELILRSA